MAGVFSGVADQYCHIALAAEVRKDAIRRWRIKKYRGGCSGKRVQAGTNSISFGFGDSSGVCRRRKGIFEALPQQSHVLPPVTYCSYCHAVKFHFESASFCCLGGRVVLVSNELPDVMQNLLLSMSEEAKLFRVYIRTYNNMFSFTSLGASSDVDLVKRNNGIYTFRVQGQVYHFLNDLVSVGKGSKNLELYFHDTEHEVENRLRVCDRLSGDMIALCMDYLLSNPYARFFRSLEHLSSLEEYCIVLRTIPGQDQRVYNKPNVSQVAAIWVEGEESDVVGERNIQVTVRSGESRSIEYYFGCYDPLQYPLMFPFGELGWHQHIPKVYEHDGNGRSANIPSSSVRLSCVNVGTAEQLLAEEKKVLGRNADNEKFVSVREYYSYKLQIRPNDKSYLLKFGRLLQQYVVDMYVKLETQRLAYYRTQQDDLWVEVLQGVVDAVAAGETECSAVGRRVILPADFIGGPRNMRRKYVDAMALVQRYGKPDLFITMTCNPNWPEFKEHLMSAEEVHNRPDLVSRIFNAKIQVFKDDILKKHVLGEVAVYTYVIEFQKRGLPHAYFLLILKPNSKMYHVEEYDQVVCAEIPDDSLYPYLFKMVHDHMMHGPCGDLNPDNICMRADIGCKNKYPRSFCSYTTQSEDAYPTYRRRDCGRTVRVRQRDLDNRWVVPYNPYLLCKFNCHINVEICSTVKAIKYIYKYICKGSDKISFSVSANNVNVHVDEIKQFQCGRWISPPEAMWRIFRFSLGEIKPAVIHLQLHLENHQPLTFRKRDRLRNVMNNSFLRKTMLTEFFYLNRTDSHAQSLNLTYAEVSDHFVWKADGKYWSPRQSGLSIGRIVVAHPSEGERYFLRILLSKIRCPKSFAELKFFNGRYTESFQESALLRGFLIDDNVQHLCLQEACQYHMPYELRMLFANLLVYNSPSDPYRLWNTFEDQFLEDFVMPNESAKRQARLSAFRQVNLLLQSMGKSLEEFAFPSHILRLLQIDEETREIRAEYGIVVSVEDISSISKLNYHQKLAFDTIMARVVRNDSGVFFVDGPGGTGKTFLYRALLAKVRSSGGIALATATSGIAASLLPGGRTAHSRFKIPLDTSDGLHCKVSKQSSLAHLIRESKLIIWDEAPMSKRSSIESLDRLLRDLLDPDVVFGGKVVVFGGDFRQTLPVVYKGNKAEAISVSLINSPLWPCFHQLSLHQNMRALLDPEFTQFLLRLGNGDDDSDDTTVVNLPQSIVVQGDCIREKLRVLIDFVFPGVFSESKESLSNVNCAILTTKNCIVDEVNDMLIAYFPGEKFEYCSFDEMIDVNDQGRYEDLLHTLTPNGMAPHKLVLKENVPVILLRNMNPTEGLCNGTRLICKEFSRNVIRACIAFGDFAGKEVFIHRIPMLPPTGDRNVLAFKRMQFPIKLCFAMTINKAQGQTLDYVGVYLKEPFFSHGQLYVALSRARRKENVKVLINKMCSLDDNVTFNIVYKEIFSCIRVSDM